MQTKIKSLHLENFGKHSEAIGGKPLDIQLGKRTIISGCNKTGKSTIKRSIQYIFGCKDENGKEITGIRPHDENGVEIDGLTTVAEMTVLVDGAENTLKKTYFQKKNRQGEYTGEDNTQYFIDGVRKSTKKSYEEFVQAILPDHVCMSAQEFFKRDTTGRRNLLESTFFSRTIDEIIDQNPEFEELRGKLRANSVSDLKSACNERINGKGRGANHVDGLNDKLTKLIHQIEFELSKKVDIDVAELEEQKKAIDEKISKLEERQEDISKEFEAQQKASDGILELKFELNDLQRKANEENNKKRLKIQNELDKANSDYDMYEAYESGTRSRIKRDEEKELPLLEQRLKEKQELWKSVKSEQIDEDKYICPTCHRELPEEEKENILSNFEETKKQRLEFIVAEGEKASQAVKDKKEYIEDSKKEAEEYEKKQEEAMERIKELEKQLSELPESIDISDRPEVQEIQRQIAEKEAAMNKGNSAEDMRKKLKGEEYYFQSQLTEVEKQLVLARQNADIDKTVEELNAKQQNTSQEIANAERELDLLKNFGRKKAEILESDVNSNFEYIKVKMTEPQVNGDLKDVCQITVDGESYDRNLNHGARILAEIDICRAFQKANNVCLPIIVDDCESLDDWRVPDVENQLIIIKRSDDRELKVEVM